MDSLFYGRKQKSFLPFFLQTESENIPPTIHIKRRKLETLLCKDSSFLYFLMKICPTNLPFLQQRRLAFLNQYIFDICLWLTSRELLMLHR